MRINIFEKSIILMASSTIFFCSCGTDNQKIESVETTVAGVTRTPILDGKCTFYAIGEPFTEKEITETLNTIKEWGLIDDDWDICETGYYHINSDKGYLDYNYITLLIFHDKSIYGELELHRIEKDTIEVSKLAENGKQRNNEFELLLQLNPDIKFAMVYSAGSEFAIAEDGTVNIISGYLPDIKDNLHLFDAYNMEDNIISYNLYKEYLL